MLKISEIPHKMPVLTKYFVDNSINPGLRFKVCTERVQTLKK